MRKNLLKSIRAVLAGLVLVVVASVATGLLLITTGLMKQPFHRNNASAVSFVVFYRCLYGIMVSYLMANLAPDRSMNHAITGGIIGFFIAALGAIVCWTCHQTGTRLHYSFDLYHVHGGVRNFLSKTN